MIYVFHLLDKADGNSIRAHSRPQHRAYVAKVAHSIAFAGPLLRDDGSTRAGSLLAIDFPDKSAALAWLAAEPYYQQGLYDSVSIHPFLNFWEQKAGFPVAG